MPEMTVSLACCQSVNTSLLIVPFSLPLSKKHSARGLNLNYVEKEFWFDRRTHILAVKILIH